MWQPNKKLLSILLITLSLTIFLSILGSFLYFLTNTYYAVDRPFGISHHYSAYERATDQKVSSDFLTQANDPVTVLSLYPGEDFLGLYDSRNFYLQALKATNPKGRYFNPQEYKDKDSLYLTTIFTHEEMQEDDLYRVDPQVGLYDSSISYYYNLTSLDHLGEIVYVDADDVHFISPIEDQLLESGYKSIPTHNFSLESFFKTPREATIFATSLGLLFMLILSISNYWTLLEKRTQLNVIQGGLPVEIFKKTVGPLFLIHLILVIILALLYGFFIASFPNALSLTTILLCSLVLSILHVLFFTLIHYLVFKRSYKRVIQQLGSIQ